MSAVFKKTIILSLLGHITVFSFFSFTFGDRMIKANYASIYFLGSFLRNPILSSGPAYSSLNPVFKGRLDLPESYKLSREYALVFRRYVKPQISLSSNEEKITFIPKGKMIPILKERSIPALVFHPSLPYHFLLYFKDRQKVHIELIFNIISKPGSNTVLLKRKISSGNLEADLLSMRYIGHYLFIQQARFTPNKWQSVKIDLSAGND